MRPLQWTKNAVVLAALVFGMRLVDPGSVWAALLAAAAFCGASSGGYLLNDALDREQDRRHPEKRFRPLAAGEIGVERALVAAVVLLVVAVGVTWAIRPALAGVTLAYAFLMVGYSLVLKQIVIVDVLVIALGFVLRAVAGAIAIDVTISAWLLACTLLLALFLGFGKRRHELASAPAPVTQRRTLESYSLPLLDQLITICATATMAAYVLYTVEARGTTGQPGMLLTAPIVVYAVFRYLFLLHRKGGGGNPEVVIWSDLPLLAALLLWGGVCVAVLYVVGGV
ncbi:MAG: decaprenyl-phosphate phosphoribosyltransferase [Chloroflexia bacterium]|nr:decaprenyl-phosphate phosphoribosyltransferase [Chloroflexia bacterium]